LNGAASSITVASPLANRARIARLVGSDKAANVISRFLVVISNTLYKAALIVKRNLQVSSAEEIPIPAGYRSAPV
jgi:hypothetical protein